MTIPHGQVLAYAGVAILMVGLGILVALAQQRRDLRDRVDPGISANDGVLDCDPGPDPYNSNSITVSNNTDQSIDGLRFDIHRCKYEPGIVEQYRGRFVCEPSCEPGEESCRVGTWDGDASNQGFALEPGESRTFTAQANQCEIIQVDVQNPGTGESVECHNVRSSDTVPPGDRWPGGIAFGISQNSTGYNASTGTCPQPTTPPTQVSPTKTPTPTTPPGVPTNTPIPPTTAVFTPTPTLASGGGGIPATPTPTIPVTGTATVTTIGILGAVGLLIIGVLAL